MRCGDTTATGEKGGSPALFCCHDGERSSALNHNRVIARDVQLCDTLDAAIVRA
jgi:hypothetical protein